MGRKYSTKMSERMPKLFHVLLMLTLIALAGCASSMSGDPGGEQSYIDDHEYLAAYGEWVYYHPYGDVWLPCVVPDWEPFYYGHWIWTADGWSWTSYEPYGWLVYHYGDWCYEPGSGWFWVPGDTWWPARVQWYTFGDYTAWAPLPPPGIVWADPWDPYDFNVWIVVDINDFTEENIGRRRIREPGPREKYQQRDFVRRAPDVKHVERITKRTIPAVRTLEQATGIHPQGVTKESVPPERRDPELKKMVLPSAEKRKVERNSPRVKREVLTPAREDPKPAKETEEKEKEPKRKIR